MFLSCFPLNAFVCSTVLREICCKIGLTLLQSCPLHCILVKFLPRILHCLGMNYYKTKQTWGTHQLKIFETVLCRKSCRLYSLTENSFILFHSTCCTYVLPRKYVLFWSQLKPETMAISRRFKYYPWRRCSLFLILIAALLMEQLPRQ